MAEERFDLVSMIEEVVRKQTRFMKHYIANVFDNEDELKRGRVFVGIPELNIVTEDKGFWAFPRDKNSMSIPKKGAYVEVYFINGNPSRPVYMGIASEMAEQTLSSFDGKSTTHILFESPKTGEFVKYDEKQKQLDIDTTKIVFSEGTEPFVLGTQLETFLNSLVTSINTALGSKLDGLGTPGTLTGPSGILSATIKGK